MLVKNTLYYYISGLTSQLCVIITWAIFKSKVGLEEFGELIYTIGLLELICAISLLGFDSFIHRYVADVNNKVIKIFNKFQFIFFITLIFCAILTKDVLHTNFTLTEIVVYLFFALSLQRFTVVNAICVAKEYSLRSASMQVFKSILFLIFILISNESILTIKYYVIACFGLSLLIPSFIFRSFSDHAVNTTEVWSKFIHYAPQFYLSSLTGIVYMVLFRTILQNELTAELFGYFMFILMIFSQINGLWTSAFKALLPRVYNDNKDDAWNVTLIKICGYIAFFPYLGLIILGILPNIRNLLDLPFYPQDDILLLVLVSCFSMSGITSLQSTMYYKHTQNLKLFFVSLSACVCTLFCAYVLRDTGSDFMFACYCIGLQWFFNYVFHVSAYRQKNSTKTLRPFIYLVVNTLTCLAITKI